MVLSLRNFVDYNRMVYKHRCRGEGISVNTRLR